MRGVAFALALLVAGAAHAHEVLHVIERDRAIAVKAYFADGEALAYCEYQIFSPADAKIPYQKGRTDRSGYVAFVPDVPGNWRVKISDSSGHGLELDVPAEPGGRDASKPAALPRPSAGIAAWAFALRPVLGVALIGGLFVALIMFYRRKGTRK